MNTKNFTEHLKNPEKIDKESTAALKLIIEEYPYFQSARAIYLKGLKKADSFKYNTELKATAAHTTDRTVLFDFITASTFTTITKSTKEPYQQTPQKSFSDDTKDIIEELSIGKPIKFTTTESHSFNEWLQLATYKKIERTDEITPKKTDNSSIIDRFIKKNPKISRVEKHAETPVKTTENNSDSHVMTETLAKVYLEQKKFENAIKAYEILSLKYPEKSGFFADQIKRIRILQKNKS
jgi:hypothetical protein